MNGYTPFLPRRVVYGAIGVVLALVALGTFVDYPLSFALYDESSPFATFFAAYGAIPAPLGCVAAGTLFVCGRNRDNKIWGIVQSIGGILLLLSGAILVCLIPALYMAVPPALLTGIGLILSASTILVIRRLAKGADRSAMIRVALAISLALLCQLLVVNGIKLAWGRPRMRLVTSHPEVFFVPWWQLGNALKEPLMAAGVTADEFKSFPSGHTANATTMLLLGVLPYLQPKLQKYKTVLVAFGFAWAAIVALSRIMIGAHYLTDTAVGFLVSFLSIYLICSFMLCPRNKKL